MARVEYFTEEILLSVIRESELLLVPVKLKNVNSMFACL